MVIRDCREAYDPDALSARRPTPPGVILIATREDAGYIAVNECRVTARSATRDRRAGGCIALRVDEVAESGGSHRVREMLARGSVRDSS